MKPGDRVNIYQKPLTEEDFEGEATLIQLLRDRGDCQDWLVEFPDWFQARRTIKVQGDNS